MRPLRKVQLNIAVDAEAVDLIRSMATSRRGYGDLVSRLVYEERARQEERRRILRQVEAVVEAGNAA